MTDAPITSEPPARPANEKQTARRAAEILVAKDVGFHRPGQRERNAILVAFAMHKRVIYGAAFDLVRATAPIDWSDPASIARELAHVTAYEVKSTNKAKTREDFGGYFFDLTTAELLVAQSLGEQYKFAFVNVLTETWIEMTLQQVFAKARKIYPKWAVLF